jgi:hypothetical protein
MSKTLFGLPVIESDALPKPDIIFGRFEDIVLPFDYDDKAGGRARIAREFDTGRLICSASAIIDGQKWGLASELSKEFLKDFGLAKAAQYCIARVRRK